MNADDKSIEELLRMAEHVANTGSSRDDVGVTGQRIRHADAVRLIAEGYVDIWPIWHRIVELRDKGLAYCISAVWVPKGLLDGGSEPDSILDDEGRFKCILSSRIWFDEDKMSRDDTQCIYTAIDIVVGLGRVVGPLIMGLLSHTDGEDDDSDPD